MFSPAGADPYAHAKGLRNVSNALVYRFLCYVCDYLSGADGTGHLARAVGVASRAVKNTDVAVYCAEKALEVKGIGPHLANMIDRSLFHLYPQPAPPGQVDVREILSAQRQTQTQRSESARAAEDGPSGRSKKPYRPKNGTANYAFLVCMHKLRLEGQDHVSKQDLIRTAEASGLSAKSIHGTKNTSNAHSRHANWYNGWSSFLQMKQKEPALVRTWSCPLKCALTEEGMAVALELHRNAHERGMCTCGLLVDEDGGPGTPSAPRQEKVWGQWRTPEQATESKKRRRRGEGELEEAPAAAAPAVGPTSYEGLVEPFRSSVSRRELRLPPLGEGEKFSDAYEVVLFLDNREQLRGSGGGAARASEDPWRRTQSRAENLQYYTKAITDSGLKVDIGKLPVGDVTWVARRKGEGGGEGEEERTQQDRQRRQRGYHVLDYVIERKSVDDLIDSIKSNRYGMQKHLLKKSGIPNLMYLVEGDIDSHNNAQTAKTALVRLGAQDGFTVLRTTGTNTTIATYKSMTRTVERLYSDAVGPTSSDLACPTLGDLDLSISEERSLSVREVFNVQLQHIPGIGKQVAGALVRKFPTPMSLWNGVMRDAEGEEGGAGGPDVKSAAEKLKFIPLGEGLNYRTIGETKATKIMNFLFNVPQAL